SPETLFPDLAAKPSIWGNPDAAQDPVSFQTWWTAVQPYLVSSSNPNVIAFNPLTTLPSGYAYPGGTPGGPPTSGPVLAAPVYGTGDPIISPNLSGWGGGW